MDDGIRPWDAAAPLVRAAQRGDALAMDDLLTSRCGSGAAGV
ncbi:hypothetical protein [Streptomyces sp. NPDC051994]